MDKLNIEHANQSFEQQYRPKDECNHTTAGRMSGCKVCDPSQSMPLPVDPQDMCPSCNGQGRQRVFQPIGKGSLIDCWRCKGSGIAAPLPVEVLGDAGVEGGKETPYTSEEWTQEERRAAREQIIAATSNTFPPSEFALSLQCELNEARELLGRFDESSNAYATGYAANWIERRDAWLSRNAAPEKEGK